MTEAAIQRTGEYGYRICIGFCCPDGFKTSEVTQKVENIFHHLSLALVESAYVEWRKDEL